MTVVDVIALHHRVEQQEDLDAPRLLVGLHFLPAGVVDVVVGHQAPYDNGSLNAPRAAIVYVIASYR